MVTEDRRQDNRAMVIEDRRQDNRVIVTEDRRQDNRVMVTEDRRQNNRRWSLRTDVRTTGDGHRGQTGSVSWGQG